ncbi:hypothetical protein BV20DRAFT_965518 [Pilatotrama ljubarskyi]|nr:hypothetical protein BV20DRAFT_965518 [Pilatotrama ljubarskyi]
MRPWYQRSPVTLTLSRGSAARTHAVQPQSHGVGWHCRSCGKDPCEEPVTTICGHIFCQSCMLQELALTAGCCPACKKTFFVLLDLTV